MKALIKVGYACNENCTFCHTLDVRHVDGSSAEVHRKIDRAKQLGHTMVVLSGGEATIRPELFEWAAHVAKNDLDLGLVTNGLLLAYPEALEKLLKYRLKYVYMSLHGGTAKIHNLLVRAQTFDQSRKALQNLVGRGLDVCINCVVTKQNVDHLRSMVDLVLPYPDISLKFSMVQPKGGGDKHFNALMPSVTDASARVLDALQYATQRTQGAPGPRFVHDGFPFCHLPGFERNYADLKTDRYWSMVEIGEDDFFPVDDQAKVQPPACRSCAIRGACPGLYKGYAEEFGTAELRPVTDRPRSNSFNYVFEKLVAESLPPPSTPDACPVFRAGITPWDRGRHLFVQHQGRLARYRADTRDFADVEIAEIKHDLGQLYLDASRKHAPDDFARDLVPLQRAAVCTACPSRDRCTGLHEPLFEDVFTRDDLAVRDHLASLRGRVLDVGCGDGPYGDLFGTLVASGHLQYEGLDPDPARIASLAQRWPWATLHAETAESFLARQDPAVRPAFDHVLILRSWNHLHAPAAALAALLPLLRPGGSLLVVDNVAFGLARTPRQTRSAEQGPSQLEHFRNDRAADARPLVESAGFVVDQLVEVGPGRSNQWLLRAHRSG